ncbi:DUF1428 domain-containing protein [Fodinicurvata sp. EGI_FJ10296]|uniref:DUF1428 domain-containing protein n=1 Tax=Fodinicurvata sp. EGI_FJ10296 TaxID=3231908 RepID=UPI003453B57A
MVYVEGFVAAVPIANKEAYRAHAASFVPIIKESGATRVVEAWEDDVPDGEVTDFRKAVKAKPDEAVVFSWFEYPSKQARDAANATIMNDPRMKEMGTSMPLDCQRMIMGGFEALVEEGSAGGGGYVEGSVMVIPNGSREAFRAMAEQAVTVLKECGAIRTMDTWGDDVPDGKVTDFKRAVKANGDETVSFGWIEWPSKQVRDEGWEKAMADPRMNPGNSDMPMDGKRMIHGGFVPILDE